MNATEFAERRKNLFNYFNNQEKWKENEFGEFVYYKGKRNLKELKFLLQLVFGDDLEILVEDFFKNYDEEIIGGSISGKIFVDADFNGMRQGTNGADVFIKFTLVENAYFNNQASSLETLQ